ncbi:MAG: hypothetical protein KAV87_49935 [Desulfobacteraceae bacterium]|nr:hypothetical protein [Desulfobacteraceae bacterium]
MKKRRTWQSKLTKAEFKHLKEAAFEPGTRVTLWGLERNFKGHAEMRRENPETEPCRTCRGIARKLGFEV